MRARLIVPAVLGAFVLSTAAFAAGSSTTMPVQTEQGKVQTAALKGADRCVALEKQFDEGIKTHATASKAATARDLRTQGGALCSKQDYKGGIGKLEQALHDIGLKPVM